MAITSRELKLAKLVLAARGKGVQKRRRNRRKGGNRPRARVGNTIAMHPLHYNHAMVLTNPNTAPLTSGVYDGEVGIMSRFTQEVPIVGGLTVTCFGYIFHPNTGYCQAFSATDSTTTITSAMAATAGFTPGYAFLNGNARKLRGHAASLRFTIPALNFSNIAGEVAVGVISMDLLTVGSSTFTGDQLFQHSAARAPISRGVQEVKWYPGAFDSKYSTWSTSSFTSTNSDASDTNCVYVVYRGIPVSTTASVKADYVVEWSPRFGTGFTPTFQSKAGIPHMKTADALHTHKPGWWHNLTGEVEAAAAALGLGGLVKSFTGSKSFDVSSLPSVPKGRVVIKEAEELAGLTARVAMLA